MKLDHATTHPDPYPYYADLVGRRPFGQDTETGLWVAASAEAVSAVLADPACRVRPPGEPVPSGIVGTAAGEVFGRLVRMTDGPAQAHLKRATVAALTTVDISGVRALARDLAKDALAEPDPWRTLQFGVPARVVATLVGLDAEGNATAPGLVGDFVRCIPGSATADDIVAATEAAAALLDLLGPRLGKGLLGTLRAEATGVEPTAVLANGLGLLSQTYDATAGLIGNTLLALTREPVDARLPAFIAEVARHDAPVQNTRRFTAEPTRLLGHDLPTGTAVLLLLAAANRDPAANPEPDRFRPDRADAQVFTFGDGVHGCPGRAIATAITEGVVGAVLGHGPPLPVATGYRPSPNARIPVLVSGGEDSP